MFRKKRRTAHQKTVGLKKEVKDRQKTTWWDTNRIDMMNQIIDIKQAQNNMTNIRENFDRYFNYLKQEIRFAFIQQIYA